MNLTWSFSFGILAGMFISNLLQMLFSWLWPRRKLHKFLKDFDNENLNN